MTLKKVVILGSTGSIGQNTLRVIRHLKERFQVVGLAAKSNIDILETQVRAFSPECIAVFESESARKLKQRLPHMRIVSGMDGVCEVASLSADIVVCAMAGTIGILPTLCAMNSGNKRLALANKEVLVSAGELFMQTAQAKAIDLIPIDSEHSALFQCLEQKPVHLLRRLILTASGGPFWRNREPHACITVEQALAHPNWKMGPKVTIDSSTLMNKGLELIEAHFLFNMPYDKIAVVIHPQSVVHSMVEWIDGSIIAQLSEPNMLIPIQYALTFPERCEGLLAPFDFTKFFNLEFYPPDYQRFPCLALAYEALRRGGSASCFLNAANEELVHRFLHRQIQWQDIACKLETLFCRHSPESALSVEKILEIDTLAREQARMA